MLGHEFSMPSTWSMLCQCMANAWSILGLLCQFLASLANSWPACLMLGMESHTRDLGMNSLSFLFETENSILEKECSRVILLYLENLFPFYHQ